MKSKYEDLKETWLAVLHSCAFLIDCTNLDDDVLPAAVTFKARFFPILHTDGFGDGCWVAIEGYLSYCAAAKSARYWNATPPCSIRGNGFFKCALGVFADAAGMGIEPQPYLELVEDWWGGSIRAVGAFQPDGSLLSYECSY